MSVLAMAAPSPRIIAKIMAEIGSLLLQGRVVPRSQYARPPEGESLTWGGARLGHNNLC